jgi:NHLM bacteriocin system ABC transporter ATP-binding protein
LRDGLAEAFEQVAEAMGVRAPPRAGEPLEALARGAGLRSRRVALEPRWWRRDGGPMLGWASPDQRPVALIPSAWGYEALDPLKGARYRVDSEERAKPFLHAEIFCPALPARPASPLQLLALALAPHGRDLLWLALWGGLGALSALVPPLVLQQVMDRVVPRGEGALLVQLALVLGAAALGGAVFQLVQAEVLARIELLSLARAQAAVVDRVLRLPLEVHRRWGAGELASRTLALEALRRTLGGTALRTVLGSALALLHLGLMLWLCAPLALVTLGFALLLFLGTAGFARAGARRHREALEQAGRTSALTVQMLTATARLRVAGAQQRVAAQWEEHLARQLQLELAAQTQSDRAQALLVMLPALCTGALFVAALSVAPSPDAGTFLAFSVASGQFLAGVSELGHRVLDALSAKAQVDRLLPVLECAPADRGGADPGALSGALSVEGVQFGYRPDRRVLDGVSLRAEPGEFVAVVGPSGCGKTTLVRLLLGFEAPTAGRICFDGRDLAELDVGAVRRSIGVVMQDTRLPAGSLLELLSGGGSLSWDEAWEAARQAGLADTLRALPMGLHTLVSEGGTNLSGGQRQRLLIARALARRPPLLLFDEATSALDARTQEEVSRCLEALQVTRVVVAHRLSTVQRADRIYVMDAGRVVEEGTYTALRGGRLGRWVG